MTVDCERALAAVSESIDMGAENVPDLADAVAHCATCPACLETAAAMRRLAMLPAPEAPEELVPRILQAVADERASIAAAAEAMEQAASGTPVPEGVVVPMPPMQPRQTASPAVRYGLAALAAAAVFGAFFVMRAGIVAMTSRQATTGIETYGYVPPPLADQGAASPQGATGESAKSLGGAPLASTAAEAPGFVTINGAAYKEIPGAQIPDRSTLVTVGEVTSDLGSGAPGQHPFLATGSGSANIYVVAQDGRLLPFLRATRMFQGRRYFLQVDQPVTSFGTWPELLGRFPVPASPDGAPTFHAAGTDERGAGVYLYSGTDGTGGFAIAPNMPPDDPGGANPNWTWWAPETQ